MSGAAIACLSILALVGFGPVGDAPSATLGWRAVASTRTIFSLEVVAQSRQSAWALGGGLTRTFSDYPAALHWNGRTWSRVGPASFPKAVRSTGIGCAAESSPADVWAFAGSTNSGGEANAAAALRLENGRWKLVEQFFPAGIVTDCLVESPSEIWVFGDAHVAPGVGTWHLHGRTWKPVISGRYALDAASAVSTNDVWAEGETGFLNPVVAHWNGRAWGRNTKLTKALPKVPSTDELTFGGITATAHNDVWFRVYVVHPGVQPSYTTVVLHWNGRVWRRVGATAFGYYLPGAVPDGHGGWWADEIVGHSNRLILHAVRGRWFRVPVSIRNCRTGALYQLEPVPGSTSVLGMQACPPQPATRVTFNVLLYGPRL